MSRYLSAVGHMLGKCKFGQSVSDGFLDSCSLLSQGHASQE